MSALLEYGPLMESARNMPRLEDDGFTLVELMIVVAVIGVLAAIAIPNFSALQNIAREGAVRANMHTIQVALEDFSIQNEGFYPTSSSDALLDGRTLAQVCPTRSFPANPFTNLPSVVQFGSNPAAGHAGEIGLFPLTANFYQLKGNNHQGDTLQLVLTTGQ